MRVQADATYGQIPPFGEIPIRQRPQEPESRAHRLVTLRDEKVEQPSVQRVYLVPSYHTAQPGEAEALDVLSHLLGSGSTSALYRTLVRQQKQAVAISSYYMGVSLDQTRFWIFGIPAQDVSLETLEESIQNVIQTFIDTGPSEADLTRTKTRLIADAAYAQDSQSSLARWYGAALASGLSLRDVREWPNRIESVTAEDVQAAAKRWLLPHRCVTGFLKGLDR